MPSFNRFAVTFGLPVTLLCLTAAAAWLASSGTDTAFGPMLRVPFVAPTRNETADPAALPLNTPQGLTPNQAELRNSVIPYSQAPLQAPARYQIGAGGEDEASALQCLTSAVYYEAGQEPLAGKQAVAQVVVNRWASLPFPKTICSVVQQGAPRPGCQFTFMCDGSTTHRPDPLAWAAAESVARSSIDGYSDWAVGSSTHYHADYVVPVWATTMLKLVKIGRHIFYRWPGAHLGAGPGAAALPLPIAETSAAVTLPAAPAPDAQTVRHVPETEAIVPNVLAARPEPTPAPSAPTPAPVPSAAPPLPRPPSAPPRRALPEHSLRERGPF